MTHTHSNRIRRHRPAASAHASPSPARRMRGATWAVTLACALATAAISTPAHAHGAAHGHAPAAASRATSAPAEQHPWGIAGRADRVSRVIDIRMNDRMRFEPAHLTVRQGETVRLRVHNDGQILHELVIGTQAELRKHADLMKRFPDMDHDEAHMVHVDPGQTGDLIWHFNRAGTFDFACLLPGHFEAGMVGRITVTARNAR